MKATEIREMLRAMQAGELTVSRGIELVDMWLAGNYRDDLLPPVRDGLGEDESPWDRIDSLTQQRDSYKEVAEAHSSAFQECIRLREELADAKQQRDELMALSVTNIMIGIVPGLDGMGEEVYAKSVSDVEREFARLCDKIEAVEQQRDGLQAKVDSLMLEFCPDEMTQEQMENWAKHQRPADWTLQTR